MSATDHSSAQAGRDGPARPVSRFDDGVLTRWVFLALLAGAVTVLALDLRDLSRENGWWSADAGVSAFPSGPVLPPAVTTATPSPTGGDDPRRFVTADEATLGQPMRFTLGPGGTLTAEGSIDPGAAARFALEIEARGEYVTTVSLNSPGGALDDAMAMARLIRERGLDTAVADGSICASSCPLILAGGRSRRAGAEAAIGVHQFYAGTEGSSVGPAQAMADAQMTTARISRHLIDMGVDPALWLHALDTPPQALYYLSGKELAGYRLVNQPGPASGPRREAAWLSSSR